jgi:hypothetical protein
MISSCQLPSNSRVIGITEPGRGSSVFDYSGNVRLERLVSDRSSFLLLTRNQIVKA